MKNTEILKAMNDIDDKYIEEAMPSQFQQKKKFSLKWLAPLLAACALLVCFMAYKNMNKKDDDVAIANPWQDVSTIKEAESITKFAFNLPETINDTSMSDIAVMNDTLISVNYGDNMTVRKSSLPEDISGDYNEYEYSEIKTIDNVDVTIKANETTCSVTWFTNDYSYSFYSENVDKEAVIEIVTEIIQMN